MELKTEELEKLKDEQKNIKDSITEKDRMMQGTIKGNIIVYIYLKPKNHEKGKTLVESLHLYSTHKEMQWSVPFISLRKENML